MRKIERYSIYELQQIAKSCATWSDICRRIGYSSDSSVGSIKKYFEDNNISFESFGQSGIKEGLMEVPVGVITIDQLRDVVSSSSTYKEIGKKLGYSDKSAYGCIVNLLNKVDIRFESSASGHKDTKQKICSVCGKKLSCRNKVLMCYDCYTAQRRKWKIDKWLQTDEYCNNKQLSIPDYIKDYVLDQQKHKCAICGMNDLWNGKPLIFILDHIDGNAANQSRSNMRCVCPNCDSQLDTYKSKNKNSARSFRRNAG